MFEKTSKKLILLAALVLAATGTQALADSLSVTVLDQNGNGIPNAWVYALAITGGNPDPVATQGQQTNGAGVATFSSLVDNRQYQVVAASQGYLPGIAQQFNNAPPAFVSILNNPAVTINLTATPGLAEIDLPYSGATNTGEPLIFGQVGLTAGGSAVAFGVAPNNGAGAGTINFYNVAPSPANYYQVSAFDPQQNLTVSFSVNQPLSAGQHLVLAPQSFTNAAPPVTNLNQSQQNGQGGNLSVNGVLTSTDSTATNPHYIPYTPINFSAQYLDQYGQTQFDQRGTGTDQNGAFQIYGMIPGATYYMTTFGGCDNSGSCYQGFQDTGTLTANGFGSSEYIVAPPPGTVVTAQIKLARAQRSTGMLPVYVTDQNGHPLPQASVGVGGDGSSWQTCSSPPCTCQGGFNPPNQGLYNQNINATTGYALFSGLPSGNYQINAFTNFGGQSSYNSPGSSCNSTGCTGFYQGNCSTPGNFYRVTVDTTQPAGSDVAVYDEYGNPLSSAPVTIQIQVSTFATGVVQGTLTLPGVENLSQNPITIELQQQCTSGNCGNGGGFAAFTGASSGPTINYSIPVSSGYLYNLNFISNYWGAIFPGGGQPNIDLTVSSSVVLNLSVGAAGRILGTMRKPDGSAYITSGNTPAPNVSANGNNSGGGTQINNDGTFSMGGLLPGVYTLTAQNYGGGSFPYTTPAPAPTVTVVANQDVHQDVPLVSAVNVRPVFNVNSLPPLSIYNCAGNNNGSCPPEGWLVWALPAGTPFAGPIVQSLLAGVGNNPVGQFQYYPGVAGQVNAYGCNGQYMPGPGFCESALPAATAGSAYDFYTLRQGQFDQNNLGQGTRPYFVIESSSRSISISQAFQNSGPASEALFSQFQNSTTTIQDVPLTPPIPVSVPQAVLAGTVTATNIINQREFQALGGNFNNFLSYLPIVWVYDTTGTLRASGLVVPKPTTYSLWGPALQTSVTNDNFGLFESLATSPAGFGTVGYQIRGLTAGVTYNLVVTSPNYPPYKTTVTLGVAGSTTTLDIPLDSNTGSSLSGVVQSTNSVAIASAAVTVQAPGYGPTTVTTAIDGSWNIQGLAAGQYQILVVAAGYAEAAENVGVSGVNGSNVTSPTLQLAAANASISGTVYTNNPICPPGATCSAFGQTALQGAVVVAYDDTLSVQQEQSGNTSAALPLYRVVTDTNGFFTLSGLGSPVLPGGDTYAVFVNDPGYFVLEQTTTAINGAVTGFNFALKPKPLTVNIFGAPNGNNYEFQITNYKSFSTGQVWFAGSTGFSTATATNVTSLFNMQPDSQGNIELVLNIGMSTVTATCGSDPTGTCTLEVIAQPDDLTAPPVIKTLTFGPNLPNNACQAIDSTLLGDDSTNAQGLPNNEAPLDITGGAGGNGSGLSLPVGAVIPSFSTGVPTMCMSQTAATAGGPGVASIINTTTNVSSTQAFASGIYQVSLSSINYNKGVNLTLSYNQNGSNLNDLAIYQYNLETSQWQAVPGVQTLNPIQGTITVAGLKNLASVLSLTPSSVPSASARFVALSNGHSHYVNPLSLTNPVDNGVFAILKPSQISGGSFSATTVKIYNFPNPFNLDSKNIPLNTGSSNPCNITGPTSITTNGTVIKVESPPGISGQAAIRIYTLSGRLVDELDAGVLSGAGQCVYINWDGTNRSGQNVADGVYFGLFTVGGNKAGGANGVFKMAVVK